MDIKTSLENAIREAATAAINAGDFQAETLPEVLLEVPPQATIAKVITSARVIARNFFMVLFSF